MKMIRLLRLTNLIIIKYNKGNSFYNYYLYFYIERNEK